MHPADRDDGAARPQQVVRAASDLQDHLLLCGDDLQRLHRLLEDASQALMGHFTSATQHIDSALRDIDAAYRADPMAINLAIDLARGKLAGAITALQFQDMAAQLISHTTNRLRSCADRLALGVFADAEPTAAEPAALRANPVAQREMAAGSIDLF